jgi:hypothetical protein
LNAPDVHHRHVARWSQPQMGIDFSEGRRLAANEVLWLRRDELSASHRLSDGAAMVDLDFMTATNGDCRASATCRVHTTGTCHGLLGWIKVRLLDNWLSSAPDQPEVHWSPAVLPIDPPLELCRGEEIHLQLTRPALGDWTWSVSSGAGTRRHSTFLSHVEGAGAWALTAPSARPGLNDRGELALEILQRLKQGSSVQQIAETLRGGNDADLTATLLEVQTVALRYGGGGKAGA